MAKVIDAIINLLPLAIAFLARCWSPQGAHASIPRLWLWIAPTALIVIGQMTLLSVRGQTFGKMALGLYVVDYHNETNPGFFRAVVLRSLGPILIGALPIWGKFFAVINVLSIFGEDRRCLHDLIAGTKVVER
jgi:uncharacterized RDD family membrane protein YckC